MMYARLRRASCSMLGGLRSEQNQSLDQVSAGYKPAATFRHKWVQVFNLHRHYPKR